MKKIAVLTSGGDAQGMNAAIYAVVRYALKSGLEVYGVNRGYKGLIEGDIKKMTAIDVEDILHKGGTVLKTARCPELQTEEGELAAIKTMRDNGIEGLVVIGGDGSIQGAARLSRKYGIKIIGIPGTIDNDLAYTDYTLGFDSAVSVCVNAVNQLRDTMSCNDRSCVVEVMGRYCGDIALYTALATGAEAVVVPEVGLDIDKIVGTILHNRSIGKYDNIIIIAEGLSPTCHGAAQNLLEQIVERIPGINIRPFVTGHIQRGGNATVQDIMLGIQMGEHAVKCLLEEKTNRVVGIANNVIFDEDVQKALGRKTPFQQHLYELAQDLVKY